MMYKVRRSTFATVYNEARADVDQIREATSPFEHVNGTHYFLSITASAGFAVREDGELVFLFSTKRGQGAALVTDAIWHGATHLDCFEGHLTELYGRHGFRETAREPNWTPGGPDVVWMSR